MEKPHFQAWCPSWSVTPLLALRGLSEKSSHHTCRTQRTYSSYHPTLHIGAAAFATHTTYLHRVKQCHYAAATKIQRIQQSTSPSSKSTLTAWEHARPALIRSGSTSCRRLRTQCAVDTRLESSWPPSRSSRRLIRAVVLSENSSLCATSRAANASRLVTAA